MMRKQRTKRLAMLLVSLGLLLTLLWWTGWACRWANSQAATAIANRDLDQALQWVRVAQWFDAENAESEFLLARVCRKQGRLQDLAIHLKRAAQFGLSAERIRREELLARAQTGEIAGIEDELDRLLVDQRGDGAEISAAYVNGLAISQRFPEAELLLEAWEASYPEDPQPHYMRARMLEYLGHVDRAEAEYRATLEKDRDHFPAAYNLGRLLLSKPEATKALSYFQLCRDMPHNGLAKIGMARCHKLLGRIEQARRLLEDALQEPVTETEAAARVVGEPPENFPAAYELGLLESEQGHYDRALRFLRMAIEKNPRDLDTRYALAVALRGAGRTEEAQREFQQVAEVREALAQADRLHDRVIRNPADVESRYQMGMLYLQHESERVGLSWLRSILKYAPHHAATHLALAQYYERKSQEQPGLARLADRHRRLAAIQEDSEPKAKAD